jgi:serine/threonine-protein kinase
MAEDTNNASALPPGTRLGRYEIRSLLGAGGMGVVYLARDTELGRTVALKILPQGLIPDPKLLHRFMQEAKAASGLNHPHILTIHEIGNDASFHFIATEFIDGHTLRWLIKNDQLTLTDVLEIATQAASALEAAHAAGIIHRDIKPENVMIRRDGYVKLLDFGLAKLSGSTCSSADSSLPTQALINTDPGTVMGTANYMSPEQAKGLVIDARTDLWSLGAVIYEMVSGRAPFEASTANETISLILQKEPAPLTRYMPTVPAELERIVSKALTKNLDERYQTAKDLLIDLKRLKQRIAVDAEIERTRPPDQSREDLAKSNAGERTSIHGGVATQPSQSPAASGVGRISSGFRSYRTAAAIVLLLLITTTVGLILYSNGHSTSAVIDSIAVLPFENQSHLVDTDYLSDGITESIINSLTQLPNLRVSTRSSVFRYKGKQTDPVAIGKELGVTAVLTGRVLQRGDSLTISTELMDVRDNKQLWGEQYQRNFSELLTTQRDIAREIAANLRPKFSATNPGKEPKLASDNVEAYQLYLHGRYFFHKFTPADHKRAAQYFKDALARDPNYARAYSGLADTLGASSVNSWIVPTEGFPEAMVAAQKAVAIDDNLAEAHATLGAIILFHQLDWAKAERELKRAIELNPNYTDTYELYAYLLSATGRLDEAIDVMKRGLALDPLSLPLLDDTGQTYYWARRYDEALAQYQKSIAIERTHPGAYSGVGVVYEQKGMYTQAIEAFQQAIDSTERTSNLLGFLGHAYALSGKKTEALKILNELKQMQKVRYVSPYDLAVLYTGLGDKDQAIEQLNKAYQQRSGWIITLKVDPLFDPLRSDARFAALVQSLNLPT